MRLCVQLFKFDCEASAVVHHGYLHRLFDAANSPDTFAAVIESCLAEIDVLLADDARLVSKFTSIFRELLIEIEIKENVVTWRAGGCTQKTYTLQPEAGHVIEVRSARGIVGCAARPALVALADG